MHFFKEFDEITKIPRPSHHEECIADYLLNWAKAHDLSALKDDFNNVIITKPASIGYENFAPIALQAHTDMVCEKAEGIDHDFFNDPITYFVDDDIVSTHGRTTLGADDGLGMAMILAILSDDTLCHPKLEALFTTAEEEDFRGVENLDATPLTAKHLINIDHCDDTSILCASAGGITFTATHPYTLKSDLTLKPLHITLSGLMGGHSGEDIGNGRGNANILLCRLLQRLLPFGVQLNYLCGGTFRLAIPRSASCTLLIPPEQYDTVCREIDAFKAVIQNEYVQFPTVTIDYEGCDCDGTYVDETTLREFIHYGLTIPNGVFEMSATFKNIVDTSSNFGEVYMQDHAIVTVVDIRSNYDSKLTRLTDMLSILATQFGLDYTIWGRYTPWKYQAHSPLRDLMYAVYSELSGQPPRIEAVHAGLECGFLSDKGFTDIISIGANAENFHSPAEHFSLTSADYVYRALVKVLNDAKFTS
ncbi:beta-Ala-His dipeptidase [Peptoniphilus equinus]|uniref:Beta-Ala-His dipeptidase n=1 Tax=Peptoniphilus equinus TaxID=3016343 RepID=A0ABY7QTJ7_9FIRM|nr:beta-Ala-His dipeptidase [Peptoniphilus equinus]WBW50122.1 beta-Ala-His dipeptidase [Peptoniphilus equinus]